MLRRVFLAAGILAAVSADGIARATETAVPTATPIPAADAIDLNPKSISFPNVAIADRADTSKSIKVTVTNPAGQPPLTLLAPTTSEGFVVTSNQCVGELAPGKSCELEIAYSPTKLGMQHGKLSINTNPAARRHSVTLKGRGVAPAVKIKPKSLDFGQVPARAANPTQKVTLINSSPVPITLAVAPAATPPYNVSSNTCSTLAPRGGTCTISVEFDPASAGEFKGRLQIRDNGAKSPQHVELFGVAK